MTWKAGAASTIITPGDSRWLAGWAVRREPARATFSELQASSLALADATGQTLLFLCVDLIATPRSFCEPVIAAIQQRHAIPRENFIFAASHTHSAPEIPQDT